jgi:hypothetical protein
VASPQQSQRGGRRLIMATTNDAATDGADVRSSSESAIGTSAIVSDPQTSAGVADCCSSMVSQQAQSLDLTAVSSLGGLQCFFALSDPSSAPHPHASNAKSSDGSTDGTVLPVSVEATQFCLPARRMSALALELSLDQSHRVNGKGGVCSQRSGWKCGDEAAGADRGSKRTELGGQLRCVRPQVEWPEVMVQLRVKNGGQMVFVGSPPELDASMLLGGWQLRAHAPCQSCIGAAVWPLSSVLQSVRTALILWPWLLEKFLQTLFNVSASLAFFNAVSVLLDACGD